MKRLILTATLAFTLSANAEENICAENCAAGDMTGPVKLDEEVVEVSSVFAPKGFDANDKIIALIKGYTSSPCVQDPRGIVERVGNEFRITVKASRWANRGTLCIDMAVPFLIAVPLGPTPAGQYTISVNPQTNNPLFTQMEIDAPTNASIDDFVYASVDRIVIDPKTRMVKLIGENPSPCITLDRIAITSNGINTYAVMPIMRKEEGVICTQVLTPFEYPYQLPNDLHAAEILVHVRTLDGNSKNKVFQP